MNTKQYKSIMQALKEHDRSHNSNWYDRARMLKVNNTIELLRVYSIVLRLHIKTMNY